MNALLCICMCVRVWAHPPSPAGTYSWDYGAPTSTMSASDILLKEEQCGFVPVGLYYNDVWTYDLNCEMNGDKGCKDTGWDVLHPGDRDGACQFKNGREVCFTPGERWHHGAAMFDDDTMLIYGGFSHQCEDYCDDMWSFDTRDNSWIQIYEAGQFEDNEAPGKRWRFSLLSGIQSEIGQPMIFFGGHRLWHGYSSDNSEDNFWENHDEYPEGGYLNDLWIYTKTTLGPDDAVPLETSKYGVWERKEYAEECESTPGLEWASRNAISCKVEWPMQVSGVLRHQEEARRGSTPRKHADEARRADGSTPTNPRRSNHANLTTPIKPRYVPPCSHMCVARHTPPCSRLRMTRYTPPCAHMGMLLRSLRSFARLYEQRRRQ